MTKEQIKHAIWSIVIGAIVSGLLALFQGLLQFMQAHASDFIGGASATVTYLFRTHRTV
jgi:hypothetical protein